MVKPIFRPTNRNGLIVLGILVFLFIGTVSLATLSSSQSGPKKPLPTQAQKNQVTPTPTDQASPSPSPASSPTATAAPTGNPTPTTANVQYPAQVLDLKNWKITLPIGSSGSPTEIKQPELNTYKIDPWFIVTAEGDGVRFRAPVNGVTTSGSSYPRSELREMTNNGVDKTAWSSTSGVHTMSIEEAVTSVPVFKKHVVAGQIHDSSDDIIVIRLEFPNLYVNVNGDNVLTLDPSYTLGKKFKVKFVVDGGKTKVYYNDGADPVYTLDKSYSGAYFKAGAYTQSNCLKEIDPFVCNDKNFGEVIIYKLEITHQ